MMMKVTSFIGNSGRICLVPLSIVPLLVSLFRTVVSDNSPEEQMVSSFEERGVPLDLVAMNSEVSSALLAAMYFDIEVHISREAPDLDTATAGRLISASQGIAVALSDAAVAVPVSVDADFGAFSYDELKSHVRCRINQLDRDG